jgi:hypothetical protein
MPKREREREIWKERGGRGRGRANVGWNQTRMGVPLHTTRVTHTSRCTNKRINYPFTRLWPCVCTFTLCLPKAPRMGFWLAPCVYTYHVMVSRQKSKTEIDFPPAFCLIILYFLQLGSVEACRTRRQDSTVVVLKLAALARNILVPEIKKYSYQKCLRKDLKDPRSTLCNGLESTSHRTKAHPNIDRTPRSSPHLFVECPSQPSRSNP